MSKAPSNRLGMYEDVRQILDAALAAGGGSYALDDYGKAVHWRQRAYRFRKLFADIITANNSKAVSPYDRLTLPRVAEGEAVVHITIRQVAGKFTPDPSGIPMTPAETPNELLDIALDFANKIERGEA